MKKIIFLMLFALVSWEHALAQTFTSDGLIYNVTSSNTAEVGNQNGAATGTITIPSQVTNDSIVYSVTSIGVEAFQSCSALTSVTIPDTVTSIGYAAFVNCPGLTSITIGNSVTSINAYAFSYCIGLTSVTIPNSLTNIGFAAFNGCSGLTSVTIGNSVTNIGDYAFNGCSGLTSIICNVSAPITINSTVFGFVNQDACILEVPASAVTAYQAAAVWQNFATIVSNPTYNTSAVSACGSYNWLINNQTYLTSGNYIYVSTNDGIYYTVEKLVLTLQSNFTIDGINYLSTSSTTVAVGDNTNTTGVVVIPASITTSCGTYAVTSIGNSAFYGASGLTSITIPNSVTSIADYAFQDCTGLTSIICNVTSPITINSNVFSNVNQACTLEVPVSTVVAYQAAAVWQNFGAVVSNPTYNNTTVSACGSYTWLVNNQTYITSGTYYFASTNDGINYTVETLALTLQSNFTSSGINYVVTSLTTVAVGDNSSATGVVVIPASVTTSCGTYSVTSIGDYAFAYCSGLISITIPNSVTNIGLAGFRGCSGLTTLIIPNSVTNIGESSIRDCSGLTSITIPNSVTSIGYRAFRNCTGLTSITIGNSVTFIDYQAFRDCTSLTSIICNISTPLTIAANVFQGVNQSACSLTVPAGSVAVYEAAAVWQNFAPIVSTTTPPTASAQTFCGSKTVADLVATGTDLRWYDVATNGTALASTTAITTGTYYVTQTLNSSESARTSVAVTMNTTSPPSASAQTFVGSKTVADLVATGTDLKWYDVATNGTALTSTTAITTGTYYVSQTLNSCESARTSVAVTVTPITSPGASTNLVATGINTGGMIQFTAPASNGGSAITNYEYSTDNGATWVTPSPAVTSSPLIISSGLTNCTNYQVKIRAVNAAGSGAASIAAQLIPATTVDMGVNWTERTSAADNNWQSVAYGNGLFVAVAATGSGNRVMTSPDGITWTPRSSAVDNDWKSVTYGNGLFVAVAASGSGNRVMTSPDGITWTIRTSAADYNWSCVTFGNGLFVAVASTGYNKLMTSPDGITWTIGTVLWSPMLSVTYGNGLFVAVSINNTRAPVLSSSDGITWTEIVIKSLITSITYGNGLFIVVTRYGAGNRVMTSPDGITWTARTSAADNNWTSVTYGNGLFVAVASDGTGNRVMTSANGINWTARTSAADNSWSNVTYGNGVFVAVASSGTGNRVMTSSYSSAADAPVITSATYGSTSTVNFTQSSSSFTPSSSNYEYSADNGSNWTAVSPAATTSPITITGLSDGANSIMLRAVNSVGNSCPSNRYDTQLSVLNKNGGYTSDPLQAVDKYGAKGSGKGLSQFGGVIDVP